MTMLAKPSLPGGAPAAWADFALLNITKHFFGVPQVSKRVIDCLFAPFIVVKMMILPRQPRDNRVGKALEKRDAFLK
eukprot:COSAG06_NODE_20601_length_788_cov_2.159652_1_plen_76_part_10